MGRKSENTGFVCEFCQTEVYPLVSGSYRNHCPRCLYSKHVDESPGDRASECGGLMTPVGVRRKRGKGFQILHRCQECGLVRANRIAEDPNQPDDFSVILRIMTEEF